MQKVTDIRGVFAGMCWNDVGSWEVVYDLTPKDGEAKGRPQRSLCLDSGGNMIVAKKKSVVAVGVHALVIVETDDALLIFELELGADLVLDLHTLRFDAGVDRLQLRGLRFEIGKRGEHFARRGEPTLTASSDHPGHPRTPAPGASSRAL